MTTNERLQKMLDETGWSVYKLAKECGLNESTIRNIFMRNTTPSIETLTIICKAFGISLAQFFADGNIVEMTPELKEFFGLWVDLTQEQKEAFKQMLQAMKK